MTLKEAVAYTKEVICDRGNDCVCPLRHNRWPKDVDEAFSMLLSYADSLHEHLVLAAEYLPDGSMYQSAQDVIQDGFDAGIAQRG